MTKLLQSVKSVENVTTVSVWPVLINAIGLESLDIMPRIIKVLLSPRIRGGKWTRQGGGKYINQFYATIQGKKLKRLPMLLSVR